VARYWVILAVAGLVLGTVPVADAWAKDSFLEPAENPLLGTWLLSEEGINPNLPVRCAVLRMTFTQAPRTYIQVRPNAVAAGQRIYTILDHDHIMVNEIPRCTWQRGPLNGTTPLLEQIKAEAEAKRQQAAAPVAPPPHTLTPEELQRRIDEMANPSLPHQLTYNEAIEEIEQQPQAEAAPATVPPPATTSPELQRSMDQLHQAILDLQEQARRQTGR
jgi:hypothetical protein